MRSFGSQLIPIRLGFSPKEHDFSCFNVAVMGIKNLRERILLYRFDTRRFKMADAKKYQCEVCGYIYDPAEGDPDNGIAPGTPFEDLPDDWECPLCGVKKDRFKPAE